ncbi:MAG: CDP-paratose 2-epimerase [Rhodospirillaceae bacterium]|nr:CDP-paratose 2-epimerase [Rhodospirillaceae bacterium]
MTAQDKVPAPTPIRSFPVLVTGGAGFIGSNLADRLARDGHDVLIYDSLSRPGVESNLAWLKARHPRRISTVIADIRDGRAVGDAAAGAKAVFHFAAQVAVTTSLLDPYQDFATNAQGTVSLLEALRRRRQPPPLVFASTNKVYGDLGDLHLAHEGERYLPCDPAVRAHGIDESRHLCFHTPYGCSKGAADQYVLEYARNFRIPAALLRMSCIYGPRQLGTEDQGWMAHFLRSAMGSKPITIYGDGHQIRDVLHVDDAVRAYLAVWDRISEVAGQAFNLGGGPGNAVSLLQVIAEIESILGHPVERRFEVWRPGDQRYYVSDTRRVTSCVGLPRPRHWRQGLKDLALWLQSDGLAIQDSAAAKEVARRGSAAAEVAS